MIFAEHINKPDKVSSKKIDDPTVDFIKNDPSTNDFPENSDLFKAPKEDNNQSNIVIGISICIAVISLVALFLLMMKIVNKKKKKKEFSNNNYKNNTSTPQFKIVPINRSNLKTSRFQPSSNFNDLTGCFATEAKDISIKGSDFTDCTEFDYYDYTNQRLATDGCYQR